MSNEEKDVMDRRAPDDYEAVDESSEAEAAADPDTDAADPDTDLADPESEVDAPADPADSESAALGEYDERFAELEQLTEQLERAEDQVRRQAAEFQNYRRRTEQEKARMVEFGKQLVVEQLLDVIDDFRRSLEAARDAEEEGETGPAFESLRDGVDMVYDKLMDALGKLGVETIDAVGEPFDEERHEALMQQPAPEGTEPGVVLAEIQKGYRLGDRVIRHARVVVAT